MNVSNGITSVILHEQV